MARLIDLNELTASQEAAWRDLAARATEPNPFFEPGFVRTAHAHLPARGAALLVTEAGGAWSACLPVRPVGPGGVVALRSWLHRYAFFGMPLLDRDRGAEALGDLLAWAARASRSGLVVLDAVAADGAARATLDAAMAERGLATVMAETHERAALRRTASGDYFDHVGRHHQREARRLGRRLEEALGGSLTAVDRSADPRAVEAFLRLEASGWKGSEGTAMGSKASDAAFFRELCESFRAEGRLQLLALEAGEHTVAMKCNLAAGAGLFCFKIAQDAELDRFSPGVRLERENVQIFHERRPERFMDSCAAADNVMINRLWPDRRRIGKVVIAKRDLRNAASASIFRVALHARTRVRAKRFPCKPDKEST